MDLRLANSSSVGYFSHYEPQLPPSGYFNENSSDYNLYQTPYSYGQQYATWPEYAPQVNGSQPYFSTPSPPQVRGQMYDEYKPHSDMESSYCASLPTSPTDTDHGQYVGQIGEHYAENMPYLGQSSSPLMRKNPVKANKKERRRTVSINSAFSNLRECIPNVPPDTKLSKIKTLRLATSYIEYLMRVLDRSNENSNDVKNEEFKVDLQRFKRGSKGENKLVSNTRD